MGEKSLYEKLTGDTNGDWKEYEYSRPNHGVGYFWRRSDGLRLGYRPAGRYYKAGTEPLSPEKLRGTSGMDVVEKADISWGQAAHDVRSLPSLAGFLEDCKMEDLPAHLRFMDKDNTEIECVASIDQVPVSDLLDSLDKIIAYADKRWPIKPSEQKRVFLDVNINDVNKETVSDNSTRKPKVNRRRVRCKRPASKVDK